MSTPIGRDFKRSHKSDGLDFELSRDFFVGLALGLVVAVGVFAWQQKEMQERVEAIQNPTRPEPRIDTASRTGIDGSSTEEDDIATYGFYYMLPNSEVVIDDLNQRGSASPLPNVPIERPGSYVLQPGAYRDRAEAERVQAKLSRLGITAIIQRVAVENDEFHRVRIGPISDLKTLNKTRNILRSADIDALLIRVGD